MMRCHASEGCWGPQQPGCMAPRHDRGVICGMVRWMLKTRGQQASGWASAVCDQAIEIVLSECRRLTRGTRNDRRLLSSYFSTSRLLVGSFSGSFVFVLEEKDVAGFAGAIFFFFASLQEGGVRRPDGRPISVFCGPGSVILVSVKIRNFRRRSRAAASGHHSLRFRPPSKAVPGAAAAPRTGRLSTKTDLYARFNPFFSPFTDLEDSAMRYDDEQQHRTASAASNISITRGEQLPRGAGRDLSWRRRRERQVRRGRRIAGLATCRPRTTLPLPNPLFRQSIGSSSWRWCGRLPGTPPAPTMQQSANPTDRPFDLWPFQMEEMLI